MPTRPLIAVSGRPRPAGGVAGWPNVEATVSQRTYTAAVQRAGGEPAVIPPRPMSDDEAVDLLRRFDGLVLVGGGDVDPAHYGQARHEHVYGVELTSDGLELALARAALTTNTPLLGICRGLQVLNVALGGTLHQHMSDHSDLNHGQADLGPGHHHVEVAPATRLAKAIGGASIIDVAWSYHHQSVDRLGAGLIVTARSDDDSIEAIEPADYDGWCVAVQWHPERTAETDPQQQALFDGLVAAARR